MGTNYLASPTIKEQISGMHLLRFIREHHYATTMIVLAIVDAILIWLFIMERVHGVWLPS
jgi:hypothetical protein